MWSSVKKERAEKLTEAARLVSFVWGTCDLTLPGLPSTTFSPYNTPHPPWKTSLFACPWFAFSHPPTGPEPPDAYTYGLSAPPRLPHTLEATLIHPWVQQTQHRAWPMASSIPAPRQVPAAARRESKAEFMPQPGTGCQEQNGGMLRGRRL